MNIRNEPSARNIWESMYLGEKKRQRVLSSRFKNEYVDDPVYRTFLKSSFQKKCQKRQ